MIHPTVDSALPAENATRFQQPLGKPSGFPTASTATTTTRYSRCPSNGTGPVGRALPFLPAERQAISYRLSPVRSPSAPNASVRRRRPSHRQTCLWHVGSASFYVVMEGRHPSHEMNEEEKRRGLRSQSASRWAGTP